MIWIKVNAPKSGQSFVLCQCFVLYGGWHEFLVLGQAREGPVLQIIPDTSSSCTNNSSSNAIIFISLCHTIAMVFSGFHYGGSYSPAIYHLFIFWVSAFPWSPSLHDSISKYLEILSDWIDDIYMTTLWIDERKWGTTNISNLEHELCSGPQHST